MVEPSGVLDEPPSNRNTIPLPTELEAPVGTFIHYAGLAIFSLWLLKIEALEKFSGFGAFLRQLLASFLLGSANLEQNKFLDYYSLNILLGQHYKPVQVQRQMLTSMAKDETVLENLFRLNGEITEIHSQSTFYYDPHTKHYTGMKKILKGWCSSIRFADKALHGDFIHSEGGSPLYFYLCDNYYDLRDRFLNVVDSFRGTFQIPFEKNLLFCIDRGIYGMKRFDKIVATSNVDIVTWEKDYKLQWNDQEKSTTFSMITYRNNTYDTFCYQFTYQENPWDKNPKMRQIIVRALNYKGSFIEVAILTTNQTLSAEYLIKLMFKRWVQENDFKYLIKHFYLNQIISYQAVYYEDIADTLEDKKKISGEYRAIQNEIRTCKTALKNLLLSKDEVRIKLSIAEGKLKAIDVQLKDEKNSDDWVKNLKQQRRCLKSNITRWKNYDKSKEIQKFHTQKAQLEQKLLNTTKEISRLDELCEKDYQRLDVRKKVLLML